MHWRNWSSIKHYPNIECIVGAGAVLWCHRRDGCPYWYSVGSRPDITATSSSICRCTDLYSSPNRCEIAGCAEPHRIYFGQRNGPFWIGTNPILQQWRRDGIFTPESGNLRDHSIHIESKIAKSDWRWMRHGHRCAHQTDTRCGQYEC